MRVILLLNDPHGHLSLKLGMIDLFLAAIAVLQDRDDRGDRQVLKWVPIFYNLITIFNLEIRVRAFSLQSFLCQLPTLMEK